MSFPYVPTEEALSKAGSEEAGPRRRLSSLVPPFAAQHEIVTWLVDNVLTEQEKGIIKARSRMHFALPRLPCLCSASPNPTVFSPRAVGPQCGHRESPRKAPDGPTGVPQRNLAGGPRGLPVRDGRGAPR